MKIKDHIKNFFRSSPFSNFAMNLKATSGKYFVILACITAIIWYVVYASFVIHKLSAESQQVTRIYADLIRIALVKEMNEESKSVVLEQILEVQQHIHDSHHHPIAHYAEQGTIDVDPGGLFVPQKPNEIDLLIQESQTGLDKDNNNLIYTHDFIISDNDPTKPMVLRDVENHFRYDGIKLPSKSITWSGYLKTLPWCSE